MAVQEADIDAWLDSQRPRSGPRAVPAQAPRTATGTGHAHVLVVDDEASIRELLVKTLALAEDQMSTSPLTADRRSIGWGSRPLRSTHCRSADAGDGRTEV